MKNTQGTKGDTKKSEDLMLLGAGIGITYLAYQMIKKPTGVPSAGITGIKVM